MVLAALPTHRIFR